MHARARAVVLMPTYNEHESLPVTLDTLLPVTDADVLIIDDNSPDGTGALADAMAAIEPRIRVLHRTDKRGLGAAYLDGIRLALDEGYEFIVEMDADGSHPAATLQAMLEAAEAFDLVIGSRWVPGGATTGWAVHRELISRGANMYARFVLGVPARDLTAGFRVYRAAALRAVDLDSVHSDGYCFQIDMARRIDDAAGSILEIPIVFRERELGVSKMTGGIIGEAFRKVAGWGIGRRAAAAAHLARRITRTRSSR